MLTDLQLRLLWFVLAGFILGFATSYLWEVLYARGRRWRDEAERSTDAMRYEQRYEPQAFEPQVFVPSSEPAASSAYARYQPRADEQTSPTAFAPFTEPPQDLGSVGVYQSPDFYLASEADARPLDWSALAHEEERPAAQDFPHDDFTYIEGLREPQAEALYRAGVDSFDQLAGLMPYEVTALLPHGSEVGEEEAYDWLVQALAIAQERRARLAERAPLDPPPSATA